MLHEECTGDDYDVPADKTVARRQSLLTLNPLKMFSKDNKDRTNFPMVFESEYVPKIL